MKILIVGGGGREHALAWKIAQSPVVSGLYCAPGNAGIAQIAKCVDIDADNIKGLHHFARKNKIDLTVVGPEGPLVHGIVDTFQRAKLRIFGPTRAAAELEGSKAFAKSFARRHKIPTADFATFTNPEMARKYIESHPEPLVVKANGLAAGKGALVCHSQEDAVEAVTKIMVERVFADAGDAVVIEEYLEGEEASLLALTDGQTFATLTPAQDHKPIFDGDMGPNTGGMGAYAPAPVVDAQMLRIIEERIVYWTIEGMAEEGRPYRGVLYFGLMITSDGPKLIEYNCRFGDPETQVILPLLETDLVALMNAVIDGRLADIEVTQSSKSAVCVVMSSAGYPGSYEKGKTIVGLDHIFDPQTVVFHAGTKQADKQIISNGGRVLGVTTVDNTIEAAIKGAYAAVGTIAFDGAYYRKDIGARAVNRIRRNRA